jgi:undecaprenyl-diphosphatase
MRRASVFLALGLAVCCPLTAHAGGGPFGIDHRLSYDNSGIWKKSNQKILLYSTLATVGIGALAEGDSTEFGETSWRAVDSIVFTSLAATAMKYTFRRERPSRTDDPNQWFKGGSQNHSFPSGEVATISAAVTPFIVHYGEDHPWVYALAVLPAYDAVARMKVRGHWQSDVLVGAALGTGIGLWSSRRSSSPIILSWLPGGFRIGFVHHFQ